MKTSLKACTVDRGTVLCTGVSGAGLCGHPGLRPHGSSSLGGATTFRQGRGQRQHATGERFIIHGVPRNLSKMDGASFYVQCICLCRPQQCPKHLLGLPQIICIFLMLRVFALNPPGNRCSSNLICNTKFRLGSNKFCLGSFSGTPVIPILQLVSWYPK